MTKLNFWQDMTDILLDMVLYLTCFTVMLSILTGKLFLICLYTIVLVLVRSIDKLIRDKRFRL